IYHTTTLIQLEQIFFAINSMAIISWVILQFYYNVAYNPEKQFGEVDFKKGWLFDIVGYLLCLMIIISPVVIFSTVTKIKMITYPIDKNEFISESVILKLLYMEKLELEMYKDGWIEKTPLFEKKPDENIFDYNYRFLNQFSFYSQAIAIQSNINNLSNFNNNLFHLNNFLENKTNFSCQKNIEDCKILIFLTSPSLTDSFLTICSQKDIQTQNVEKNLQIVYDSLKNKQVIKILLSQKYDYFFALINKYTGNNIKFKKQADIFLASAIQICNDYFEQVYQFNFLDRIINYFFLIFTFIIITLILLYLKYSYVYRNFLFLIIFIIIYLLLLLAKYTFLFAYIQIYLNLDDYFKSSGILNEVLNLDDVTKYFLIIYGTIYYMLILFIIFYFTSNFNNNFLRKINLRVNLIMLEMTSGLLPLLVIFWLQYNTPINLVYEKQVSCNIVQIYSIRDFVHSINFAGPVTYTVLLKLTYWSILTIIYIFTFPYIKHILIQYLSLPKEK
ncbi:MAG: hypothetical protein QNJ37_22765, partial [Crocosphaera sp.]|nr:hypothetical protein [Crocosphaera sp.]